MVQETYGAANELGAAGAARGDTETLGEMRVLTEGGVPASA